MALFLLVPKLCLGTYGLEALLPRFAKQSFVQTCSQAELGNESNTLRYCVLWECTLPNLWSFAFDDFVDEAFGPRGSV